MLSIFQNKAKGSALIHPLKHNEFLSPGAADDLLATQRRQRFLELIWQRTALSRKQFSALYMSPLEKYAELVQQFPASKNHHHAHPGGMLDHGLETVAYALKLRQSHLLPTGSTPEEQAAQTEVWSAALAYSALLHDVGKIAVDLRVETATGKTWHPWHGPLTEPYRFRYRDDREYRLHNAATGLLYHQILTKEILDWLSNYREAWTSLLYMLAGQHEHAGLLGELVRQADQASVAQELGGDPSKVLNAPKLSLQRKLLDGLRYLIKEELKLNQAEASDGWLTLDSLWLVSKTVSDKLRSNLLSQGIDSIPANNTTLFNILQEHNILQPTPDGKAIWRATITSETGWTHSFTLLRLSPALIWENNDRPQVFAGTVTINETMSSEEPSSIENSFAVVDSPTAKLSLQDANVGDLLSLFESNVSTNVDVSTTQTPQRDQLTETSLPVANLDAGDNEQFATELQNESPSGEHFMSWLRQGIATHKIIINDAKALVHTTTGTAYLVSPGVFQRYAQEHLRTAIFAKQENVTDWQWIQKRFEKLQLHKKKRDGLNIWTCDVTGPRKSRRLHGYLLNDPRCLFGDLPPNNPHLSLAE